jgi:uncharacterized protein YcbK (DUF882 family)
MLTRKQIYIGAAVLLFIGLLVYIRLRKAFTEQAETGEMGSDDTHLLNWDTMNTNNNPEPQTANFTRAEFDCREGTPVPTLLWGNLQTLMNNLQVLREDTGLPIHVNSGYRTPAYNATLAGSAPNSMHLQAKAADIVIIGYTPKQVKARIENLIAAGKMQDGGIGLYGTFVHYDIGRPRRWNG